MYNRIAHMCDSHTGAADSQCVARQVHRADEGLWGCLSFVMTSYGSKHHEKRWAGRSTTWNQDCWEKYQ